MQYSGLSNPFNILFTDENGYFVSIVDSKGVKGFLDNVYLPDNKPAEEVRYDPGNWFVLKFKIEP